MKLAIFFDYTCAHSFALKELMSLLPKKSRPEIDWRTLSLKELRRDETDPSSFLTKDIDSFSIFALALSHAARDANFDSFHNEVFDAIHLQHLDLSRNDLLEVAQRAGVDVEAFERDRLSWRDRVKQEHDFAMEKLHAVGTPTVLFDETNAFYFRFYRDAFNETDPDAVWNQMKQVAAQSAILEAKRTA